VIRRSPLDGIPLVDGLRAPAFLAQLDLRLAPDDAAPRQAVESVIGPLPIEPNTVHGGADAAVLWLGPDEWLVVGPPEGETTLEAQLRDAIGDTPGAAIVDASANRTTLELRGPRAWELLEFGCPIDLHPRVFGPGRCAQTLLARANVLIWFVADEPEPVYRLLVRPSFAAYVAAWLADASEGFDEPNGNSYSRRVANRE
jgi:sarcosine oxidase subunit gamma